MLLPALQNFRESACQSSSASRLSRLALPICRIRTTTTACRFPSREFPFLLSEHFFQNGFNVAVCHFARILLHAGAPAVFDNEIKIASVQREGSEIFWNVQFFRQISRRPDETACVRPDECPVGKIRIQIRTGLHIEFQNRPHQNRAGQSVRHSEQRADRMRQSMNRTKSRL